MLLQKGFRRYRPGHASISLIKEIIRWKITTKLDIVLCNLFCGNSQLMDMNYVFFGEKIRIWASAECFSSNLSPPNFIKFLKIKSYFVNKIGLFSLHIRYHNDIFSQVSNILFFSIQVFLFFANLITVCYVDLYLKSY